MAVDELSQDFLRVLLEHGGDADTTTIRRETGMSRGQVNHRYRKLDDLDWIEIERAEEGNGERTPPKIAVLTEEGQQAIRTGEAGKNVLGKEVQEKEEDEIVVSKEQLHSFHQEIDGMKNQLNVVVEQLSHGNEQVALETREENSQVEVERVEDIEREVSRLRETVELLNSAMTEQRKNQSSQKEQVDDLDISNHPVIQNLRDEQEFLKEWMDVAETHMMVMRLFMDDHPDIDMAKYFKEAAEAREE